MKSSRSGLKPRVRSVFVFISGILCSLGLGLWTAWLAVQSPAPIDAITLGAWQAWPNAGTEDVDPYSRARLARTGEIPLGPAEGLTLLAQNDDRGAPLTSRCNYRIVGQTPPARLWTLAVEYTNGRVIVDRNELAAIASDTLLRGPDGSFEVVLSPDPKPGNWVSTDEASRFRVAIRLYDTTVRTTTALTALSMPRISRERCT